MGIDLVHIVRHGFRQYNNHEASLKFVDQTIQTLKDNLFINEENEGFTLAIDKEDFGYISFHLPVYDVDFVLHNGFWEVESAFRYCQLFFHDGASFWLRELGFDIARALGQQEIWYADEYHAWDGECCGDAQTTFEQWNERATKKLGKGITEFDVLGFSECDSILDFDFDPVYHDSLEDCRVKFEKLQSELPEYRLLGISTMGDKFLRCEKEGQLFLVDSDSGESLFKEPIDNALHPLNGPEFVVYKNGLSAVFDSKGHQLTDFVKGKFEWKWGPGTCLARIVYNEEAGIEICLK